MKIILSSIEGCTSFPCSAHMLPASRSRRIRSILSDVLPLYHIRVESVCVLCKIFQSFHAFLSASRTVPSPDCTCAPLQDAAFPPPAAPPLCSIAFTSATPCAKAPPSSTEEGWRRFDVLYIQEPVLQLTCACRHKKRQTNSHSGTLHHSNSTTCVQPVRNSRSAPCCLVICAAATIGSHFCTY